jgi:hypothetical protein
VAFVEPERLQPHGQRTRRHAGPVRLAQQETARREQLRHCPGRKTPTRAVKRLRWPIQKRHKKRHRKKNLCVHYVSNFLFAQTQTQTERKL